MGSAASVATGSTQPAPECIDKTACPAVTHCAVHVLRDGMVAAVQTWCQHDSSAGPGREANQRHLQRRIAHGFFEDRSVNQDLMLADLDVLSADDHCRMAHARQYARHAAASVGGCLRRSRCWPAFAFLLGHPSIRGCSAYGLVLCLPRRCSLRLLLFCTCPPLCTGALWPMPAWVWRDVQFYFYFIFLFQALEQMCSRL